MPAARPVSPKSKKPETVAIVFADHDRRNAWRERLQEIAGLAVAGVWATVADAHRAGVKIDVIVVDVKTGAKRPERRGLPELSPREVQVMALLAGGCRDKELPERLGISAHTARTFLRRAMVKLGASSRAEAVMLWSRLGPR